MRLIEPTMYADYSEEDYSRLYGLFGSMIGAPNAVEQMGAYVMDPKMLPRNSDGGERIEARFLRVFYSYYGDNDPLLHDEKGKIIVSRRNMVDGLAPEVGEKQAAHFVDMVIEHKPIDANIFGASRSFYDWTASRLGARACQLAQVRFDGRMGTIDEQWQSAMEIIEKAAPRPKTSRDILGDDAFAAWEKIYEERRKLAKEGRTQGPVLPWGLRRKVAMLKKGDLCTVAAKSSMGKSTVALLLAHEIAHKQKGYDVLYLYMETHTEAQLDRLISHGIDITVSDLRNISDELDENGKVIHKGYDLFDDKVGLSAYRNYVAEYQRRSQEFGRVWFSHCPGLTAMEFKLKVGVYKALAAAKGRELVVLVDYYSLLSTAGLVADSAPGWAQNDAKADFFKEQAEQYEIYLVTFAQDNMEADYTDNARKTTKNGSLIYERSQVVIRIMREWATADLPIKEKVNGQMVQKKDLAGRPMFWHEADQPSSDADLQVEKVSEGAVGPVSVAIMGAYFRIFQITTRKAP